MLLVWWPFSKDLPRVWRAVSVRTIVQDFHLIMDGCACQGYRPHISPFTCKAFDVVFASKHRMEFGFVPSECTLETVLWLSKTVLSQRITCANRILFLQKWSSIVRVLHAPARAYLSYGDYVISADNRMSIEEIRVNSMKTFWRTPSGRGIQVSENSLRIL